MKRCTLFACLLFAALAATCFSFTGSINETTTVDLGDGVTMTLAAIASGTFTMGRPSDEPGRWAGDWLPHQVTLSKGFYMGTTEVTQAQWLKVMSSWPGTAPSSSYGVGDTYPAYYISWYDAVRFCNKLSTDKGLSPCYTDSGGSTTIDDVDTVTCSTTANGYRLPTEAEWEYACRAGTTTSFSWGTSNEVSVMGLYCWYNQNSGSKSHPVGEKLPNAWGLYDMSGNLMEWCSDWEDLSEDLSARGDQTDPRGPVSGSGRVLRGGRWGGWWASCRSAYRSLGGPSHRSSYRGFRLVRTIP